MNLLQIRPDSRSPLEVARAQRGTILAVDDRKQNVDLLQNTLGEEGYEVIPASSGTQALACVSRMLPDLILLDVMMPDMSGFDVCQRLKHDPRTAEISVIFLSAAGDKNSVIRGIEAGGVDYVTKPFTRQELVARVNTHVTLKHLLDRHRGLLQARHRLVAQEMEDLRRPLRAIVQKLTEISRHASPAASVNEDARLLAESLALANEALRHLCEESPEGPDKAPGAEYPVTSAQLEELIGRWYLSARRRRIGFQMTHLPWQTTIACHLSPLTYLIDLLMSSLVNDSNADDLIQVKLELQPDRVLASIAHTFADGRPSESRRDSRGDFQGQEASLLDLQLIHETNRIGGSLSFDSQPDGREITWLSLPLHNPAGEGTLSEARNGCD